MTDDCVATIRRWDRRRGGTDLRQDEPMTSNHRSEDGDWTYVVDKDIVDRAEATLACQAVLDVLRPRLTKVRIDAYSAYRDELPPEVAQAQQWLRDVGLARGHGDPGMGIELDPADDSSWDVLLTYASWSINVDLLTDRNRQIAQLHDCGYSVTAELTADEAVQVTRKLADIAPVVPLLREREKAERAAARQARRARRRERSSRYG
jgi:hypothetical protein